MSSDIDLYEAILVATESASYLLGSKRHGGQAARCHQPLIGGICSGLISIELKEYGENKELA